MTLFLATALVTACAAQTPPADAGTDVRVDARMDVSVDRAADLDAPTVGDSAMDTTRPPNLDAQISDAQTRDRVSPDVGGLHWELAATTGPANGSPYQSNSFWPSAMVYEPTSRSVVLFGGAGNNETWVWDGASWTHRATATAPSSRAGHLLAFDTARNELVLFGGSAIFNNAILNNETWIGSATTWTERVAATQPRRRTRSAMAFDEARGRMVLFGGSSDVFTLNDTWEWDGVDWTRVQPTSMSPTPRSFHSMAYDPTRQRIVMFGGHALPPTPDGGIPGVGDAVPTNETWEWDGNAWTRSDVSGPPPRSSGALVFSRTLGEVLLFGGGHDGNRTSRGRLRLNDLWSWNGSRWRQISVPNPPGPRYGHVMAYDAARDEVVMFGGFGWAEEHVVFYNDETWILR